MYPLTLVIKNEELGRILTAVAADEQEEASLRDKGYLTTPEFLNPEAKSDEKPIESGDSREDKTSGPGANPEPETGAGAGENSDQELEETVGPAEADESTDGEGGIEAELDTPKESVPEPKPAAKKATRKRSPEKPKT